MLKNYFITAVRLLRRHRSYTIINVVGLSVGLASCLIIFLFVQDESRYDRFHAQADLIYRVVNEQDQEGETIFQASTPPALGPAVSRLFPEIADAVRFFPRRKTLITYQNRQFVEEAGFIVDSTVFDVFTFSLLKGDRTALDAPYTIVLTESTARKYFGQEDPLGKTLTLDNTMPFEVTGVIADLPPHSHIQFSYLGSFATMKDIAPPALDKDNWRWQDFYTYVRLAAPGAPAPLEAKIAAFTAEHTDPITQRAGYRHGFRLQPLVDIYLHSGHLQVDIAQRGSITAVRAFSWVAILILLIACFNYVNLALARSANRAKEVGLRKVVGAERFQLIKQFLSESVLTTLLSLMLGLVIVALCLPAFNQLFDKSLSLSFGQTPWMMPVLIGACLFIGVLAGGYPAFILSAFRPATVLKGRIRAGGQRLLALRKVLVVTQFVISTVLIIATAVVFKQLTYLQNQDMGLEEEQVIVMSIRSGEVRTQLEAFKEALLQQPGVVAATASWGLPSDLVAEDVLELPGREGTFLTHLLLVDHDYIETFGMEIVAGRNFSESFATDADQAFILNETAARAQGWSPEEALGQSLAWGQWNGGVKQGSVVGVVKDFNIRSLHEAVEPVVLTIYPPVFSQLAVRIGPENVANTLEAIKQTWESRVSDWPFEYSFLDAKFAALYQAERTLSRLFLIFSGLGILIACLGLLGLVAFAAAQRTKEIGVRKVLGASVVSVFALLSTDFVKLLGVAFLIALPISYLGMQRWLEGFAYRTPLTPSVLLIPMLLVLSVALLTVSYQAIKAATADPVKSLRYE